MASEAVSDVRWQAMSADQAVNSAFGRLLGRGRRPGEASTGKVAGEVVGEPIHDSPPVVPGGPGASVDPAAQVPGVLVDGVPMDGVPMNGVPMDGERPSSQARA